MANEGFLGRFAVSGERAATDDHPVILHALPLAVTVAAVLAPGTLMKRVPIEDEDENLIGYVYAPWAATDTEPPCAVVDKPCDPTGESAETSAICIVHGTVKTHLLKVGSAQADALAIAKLRQAGIFAC